MFTNINHFILIYDIFPTEHIIFEWIFSNFMPKHLHRIILFWRNICSNFMFGPLHIWKCCYIPWQVSCQATITRIDWGVIQGAGLSLCLKFMYSQRFNTLRPRQNASHFADDILKHIFMNQTVSIVIKISLNFIAKGPINNIPALVEIMAWRRPGDKPLSEPMMVSLPMHISVTRPHCVKEAQKKINLFEPNWPISCHGEVLMSHISLRVYHK